MRYNRFSQFVPKRGTEAPAGSLVALGVRPLKPGTRMAIGGCYCLSPESSVRNVHPDFRML